MGSALEETKPSSSSNKIIFEAQAHLYKHVFGYLNGMVLKCAIHLNIPDIIHNHGKPITIPELASKLQVHPTKTAYIGRLVRLLVHNGFLAESKALKLNDKNNVEIMKESYTYTYTLTPSSKLLIKGNDPCLVPFVTCFVGSTMSTPFDMLHKWFKGEEKSATETAFGMEWWDLLEGDEKFMSSFNEAMASDSQIINMALRECGWVFKGLDSLVDVGGGTGTTARIISEAYPNLKCMVFDLPHVVQNLKGDDNLSYVGGNMFDDPIPYADVVLLKWVLHDWNDERCIKILKKCKEAISSSNGKGKVIIIDSVINEKMDEHAMTEVKLLCDVLMLAIDGKERNVQEWDIILHAAGFKHYNITPFFGFKSIIEVFL